MKLIIYLILTILIVVVLYFQASTNSFCLQRGYSSSKVDMTLTGYCIKRVDQTDVVVPVKGLK